MALLYGSLAARGAKATSDVDLLVVAEDVTLEELYRALAAAEERLGRKITAVGIASQNTLAFECPADGDTLTGNRSTSRPEFSTLLVQPQPFGC
jgi:predicted nucleotidyltransferase